LIVGFEHKKFPPKKDADDYLYVSNILGTDGKNNFIQVLLCTKKLLNRKFS
jgi:hypothetical protein